MALSSTQVIHCQCNAVSHSVASIPTRDKFMSGVTDTRMHARTYAHTRVFIIEMREPFAVDVYLSGHALRFDTHGLEPHAHRGQTLESDGRLHLDFQVDISGSFARHRSWMLF